LPVSNREQAPYNKPGVHQRLGCASYDSRQAAGYSTSNLSSAKQNVLMRSKQSLKSELILTISTGSLPFRWAGRMSAVSWKRPRLQKTTGIMNASWHFDHVNQKGRWPLHLRSAYLLLHPVGSTRAFAERNLHQRPLCSHYNGLAW